MGFIALGRLGFRVSDSKVMSLLYVAPESGIVFPLLPAIAEHFGADATAATWTMTGVAFSEGTLQPPDHPQPSKTLNPEP